MKVSKEQIQIMRNDIAVVVDYLKGQGKLTDAQLSDANVMYQIWGIVNSNRKFDDTNKNVIKVNGQRLLPQNEDHVFYIGDTNDTTIITALKEAFKHLPKVEPKFKGLVNGSYEATKITNADFNFELILGRVSYSFSPDHRAKLTSLALAGDAPKIIEFFLDLAIESVIGFMEVFTGYWDDDVNKLNSATQNQATKQLIIDATVKNFNMSLVIETTKEIVGESGVPDLDSNSSNGVLSELSKHFEEIIRKTNATLTRYDNGDYTVTLNGELRLNDLTSLPSEGEVSFMGNGTIIFGNNKLTHFPKGTTFRNNGDVIANYVTEIEENVYFGSEVNEIVVTDLLAVSDNVRFNNKGEILINQDTVISEDTMKFGGTNLINRLVRNASSTDDENFATGRAPKSDNLRVELFFDGAVQQNEVIDFDLALRIQDIVADKSYKGVYDNVYKYKLYEDNVCIGVGNLISEQYYDISALIKNSVLNQTRSNNPVNFSLFKDNEKTVNQQFNWDETTILDNIVRDVETYGAVTERGDRFSVYFEQENGLNNGCALTEDQYYVLYARVMEIKQETNVFTIKMDSSISSAKVEKSISTEMLTEILYIIDSESTDSDTFTYEVTAHDEMFMSGYLTTTQWGRICKKLGVENNGYSATKDDTFNPPTKTQEEFVSKNSDYTYGVDFYPNADSTSYIGFYNILNLDTKDVIGIMQTSTDKFGNHKFYNLNGVLTVLVNLEELVETYEELKSSGDLSIEIISVKTYFDGNLNKDVVVNGKFVEQLLVLINGNSYPSADDEMYKYQIDKSGVVISFGFISSELYYDIHSVLQGKEMSELWSKKYYIKDTQTNKIYDQLDNKFHAGDVIEFNEDKEYLKQLMKEQPEMFKNSVIMEVNVKKLTGNPSGIALPIKDEEKVASKFNVKNIKGREADYAHYTHFAIHKETSAIAFVYDYSDMYPKQPKQPLDKSNKRAVTIYKDKLEDYKVMLKEANEELNGDKIGYFYEDLKNEFGGEIVFKASDYSIVAKTNLQKANVNLNDFNLFQGLFIEPKITKNVQQIVVPIIENKPTKEKTWMDFISYKERQIIPERYTRMTKTELIELRDSQQVVYDRKVSMRDRNIQSLKELLWMLNDLIAAHEKAETENGLDTNNKYNAPEVTETKTERFFIEFLNKDKNFKEDKKIFDEFDAAVNWGKSNLDNFNSDMIRVEFVDSKESTPIVTPIVTPIIDKKPYDLIPTNEVVTVEDYPYGYSQRTSLYDSVEFSNKKGYRRVTQTKNPKTGRLNAPKKSTYSDLIVRHYDDNMHIKQYMFNVINSSDKNLTSIAKFVSDNFTFFTEDEIKYLYKVFNSALNSNAQGHVNYSGSKIEDIKPLYKNALNAVKEGFSTPTNNYFGEIVRLDFSAIEATTNPNHTPFGN